MWRMQVRVRSRWCLARIDSFDVIDVAEVEVGGVVFLWKINKLRTKLNRWHKFFWVFIQMCLAAQRLMLSPEKACTYISNMFRWFQNPCRDVSCDASVGLGILTVFSSITSLL